MNPYVDTSDMKRTQERHMKLKKRGDENCTQECQLET